MASRNLTVVAQVKDAASSPLNRIAAGFDKTNKSIKTSTVNFTEFNRVMFSATAFIGMFSNGLRKIGDTLDEAGNFERLSNQFEKVMGPRGKFFKQIEVLSANSVDRIEAMRGAIALSTLGIITDSSQMADLFARAGSAAKKAGLQTGEGIQKLTKFMKDGQVEHLSFLNVLSATNPELQAQMAILNKAGGVMGNVISTQQRLRLGQEALRLVTKDMAKDEADLADVMLKVRNSISFARNEIGILLGKAFTPMLKKITDLTGGVEGLFERIRKNDKWLYKMGANLIFVGSAILGTVAALGALRMALMALGALGIGGIPLVTASIVGLVVAMQDGNEIMDSLAKTSKKLGMSVLGISQLVSSFLMDADNFSKGVGKMDSSVHKFLKDNGLLDLVTQISRVSAVVLSFARDVGKTLTDWSKKAQDSILGVVKSLESLFGISNKDSWARGLVTGMGGLRGMLVKVAAATLAIKSVSTIAKPLLGAYGKGKVLSSTITSMVTGGKLGEHKPSGTMSDPIYVKIIQDIFGPIQKLTKGFDPNKTVILAQAAKASLNRGMISSIMTQLGRVLTTSMKAPLTIFAGLSAVGAAKGSITGVKEGLDAAGGLSTLFKNLSNLASAVESNVDVFFRLNPAISEFLGTLGQIASFTIQEVAQGYENIVGYATKGVADVVNGITTGLTGLINRNTIEALMLNPQTANLDSGFGVRDDNKYGIVKTPEMANSSAERQAQVMLDIQRLENVGSLGEGKKLRTMLEMYTSQDNDLDPEEYANIYAAALKTAINESDLTKETKKKSEPKPPITRSTRC